MDPHVAHALDVVRAAMPARSLTGWLLRRHEADTLALAEALVRRARKGAARTGRPTSQVLADLLLAWRAEREAEAAREIQRALAHGAEVRARRDRAWAALAPILAVAAMAPPVRS